MDRSFANFWQPFLQDRAFVVLDGGLATELERRGADLNDPLWSAKMLVENPGLIQQVHLDYLRAGADVITSASYQASFAGFAGRGLSTAQARQLMIDSVRLAQAARAEFAGRSRLPGGTLLGRTSPPNLQGPARQAGPTKPLPLVAASIGCYGACLHDGSEYRGDYGLSVRQLIDWHRPRFELLARSGADLLACETIPCRDEAEALLTLLAEFPDVPAWLSFSCRDETRVCHGETLAECVALTRGVGNVVAVGVNCTAPHLVEPLLRSVAGRAACPLLAYANSGETWDAANKRWQGSGGAVSDWGMAARRWYEAGARLIGGCCRTTPDTIRAIASVAPLAV